MNALRSFVVAAQSGSFAKAAGELHVTPAAISRSIKSLEDQLDCQLFQREHRRVLLTSEGRFYVNQLGDVFERIALATQNLKAQHAHRPLSICAYPSFIINWLIPRWCRYASKAPGFEVRLVTTHSHDVDFQSGEIDAAILSDRSAYQDCRCDYLFTANLVPVCSPDFWRNGRTEPGSTPWQRHLLHSDTRPHDWQRWIDANPGHEIDPDRGQRFESSPLMYEAAIAGMGVAIAIEEIVQRELAAGNLIIAFADPRPVPCPYFLIRPLNVEPHPFVETFRAWLFAEVGLGHAAQRTASGRADRTSTR